MEANKDAMPLDREVRALVDEVRVKLHLAGMEIKEEFTKLEPQINRAFSSASIVSNEVWDDLKKRLTELKQRLH